MLAFIVGAWHLTYGQSAWILLSAGIGAIPGVFFWGWMADKIGRRKVFIATALNFSIATGIMAEVWPIGLRASGLGFNYGVGNFGKIISPLGRAVIVGTSNFVTPAATVAAIFPAMLFLAFWAALAALAFQLIGLETKGRSIEEIDAALTGASPARATAA